MVQEDCCRLFVIVSEPRTGSNMLVSKICSTGEVLCHAEIFHPDRIYIKLQKDKIPTIEERDQNPILFLDKIVKLTKEIHHKNTIGFKLFFNHCSTMHNFVLSNKLPVILLERKNKLAQYSSQKKARATDAWTSKQTKKNHSSKIKFSIIEFSLYLYRSRYRYFCYKRKILQFGIPYIHIYYEDIAIDKDIDKVCDFIGINFVMDKIKSVYEKQNSSELFAAFSNARYALNCIKMLSLLRIFNI